MRYQAVLVSLLVRFQNCEQEEFFERPVLHARLKTHLHSEFHDEEVEEYLLHHYFCWNGRLYDVVLAECVY